MSPPRTILLAANALFLVGLVIGVVSSVGTEVWVVGLVAAAALVPATLSLAFDVDLRFFRGALTYGGTKGTVLPRSAGAQMYEVDLDYELTVSEPGERVAVFGSVAVASDVVWRIPEDRFVIVVLTEEMEPEDTRAVPRLMAALGARTAGDIDVRLSSRPLGNGIVHIGRDVVLTALPSLSGLRQKVSGAVWVALQGAIVSDYTIDLERLWEESRPLPREELAGELARRQPR